MLLYCFHLINPMSNQTLIQYFHWYYNDDEKLWQKAAHQAPALKEIGITGAWFPPSYKLQRVQILWL